MDSKLFCCYVDDDGVECTFSENLFEVRYGPNPDDYTHGCRDHLGEMIDKPTLDHPWESSIVTLVEET